MALRKVDEMLVVQVLIIPLVVLMLLGVIFVMGTSGTLSSHDDTP